MVGLAVLRQQLDLMIWKFLSNLNESIILLWFSIEFYFFNYHYSQTLLYVIQCQINNGYERKVSELLKTFKMQKKKLQNNQTEMHIRVWDDIGLVLTRAASFVYVIRWKALMATWTPNQSYLETASVFGTKNRKEWRKCRDTVLKREDGRFSVFPQMN